MRKLRSLTVTLTSYFAVLGIGAADDLNADALARFYSDKTMRILVGYGPGGGYDLYSRLISRHMGKYIPGSPKFMVQNRPGAGSLIAANLLYNSEPKDGTVFGTISEGLPFQQRLGAEGVQFDSRKFNWLGSAVQTTYACAARSDLGITTSALKSGKLLVMAGSDPGSSPYDVAAVLRDVLGLKLKLVAGYRNTPVLIQSIEQRETDALCTTLSTLLEPAGQLLTGGAVPLGKLFLVFANDVPAIQSNHPWVQGTPSAEQLAVTDEARAVLAAFDSPSRMHKPYVAPPGVPVERVSMLRQALANTFSDAGFQAEVGTSKLVASPISGEETAKVVEAVLDTPHEIINVLREILRSR